MNPLGAINDWLLYVAGVLGSAVVALAGYVRRSDRRSKANKRRLTGDPEDPNVDGVLQISKRNGEKIDHLERKMDRQHRQLMSYVEEGDD